MVAISRVVYMALVHEAEEEGGYWAEIMNLPGCVSQGETMQELQANLLEAIEAVTEASAEDGSVTLTHPDKDSLESGWLHIGPSSTDGVVTVSS